MKESKPTKIALPKKEKGKLVILGALAVVALFLAVIGEKAEFSRGKVETEQETLKVAEERFPDSAESTLADILSSMEGSAT